MMSLRDFIFQKKKKRLIKSYRGDLKIADSILDAKNLRLTDQGSISIGNGCSFKNNVFLTCSKGGELIIDDGCFFNRNCIIACHKNISIGKNCLFGPNVCIYDHNHIFSRSSGIEKNKFKSENIIIGDNVWLGANVVVLKGVKIGSGSIIGAGCVIYDDVPPYHIVKNHQNIEMIEIET